MAVQLKQQLWGESTAEEFLRALVEVARDDNAREFREAVAKFCAVRWDVPLLCVAAYLTMVWLHGKGKIASSKTRATDAAFAAWNLGLSLFSFWGAWELLLWLFQNVAEKGYYFTVCSDPYSFKTSGTSHATLALFLFAFSKFPELGDTAFLVLKGKQVRFLQWYHHSTVLLFCWLALATEYTPGIWFAATNYTVHAVMYMYFFLMTFSSLKGFVKAVAPFVTIIQITQMVYGLFINVLAISNYALGNSCHIQNVAVYAAVVMYGSYFCLFSQLFLEGQGAKAKSASSKATGVDKAVGVPANDRQPAHPSARNKCVSEASCHGSAVWPEVRGREGMHHRKTLEQSIVGGA